MRYIGVSTGHDGGIAIFNSNGGLEFFGLTERYTRERHCDLADLSELFPSVKWQPDDFVVMVANTDPNLENVSTERLPWPPNLVRPYIPKIKDNYLAGWYGRSPNFVLNHHICHAIASWCFRPDDQDRLYVVCDGSGSDTYGSLNSCLVGMITKAGFYNFGDFVNIPTTNPLNNLVGPNSAGKLMELSGYRADQWDLDKVFSHYIKASIDKKTHDSKWPVIDMNNEKDLDFAANFYRWYIGEVVWGEIKANIDKYPNSNGVVVGGGTALAIELNTKIFNHTGQHVVCAPCADNSGQALGAAAFAHFQCTGRWPMLKSPSLIALQTDLPEVGRSNPKQVALRVYGNNVVGVLRGRAEAGPRSLGFRSMFAAPGKYSNAYVVSQKIKQRETYRPLSPVITDEQFDNYFVGPRGKFMQYKVQCTERATKELPSIVHKDGSATPQVVSYANDPWLHNLLTEYGK